MFTGIETAYVAETIPYYEKESLFSLDLGAI